jgi:hypothetical protein
MVLGESRGFRLGGLRAWLMIVLAVSAFAVYAAGALMIHRQQKDTLFQERSSLAAAMTNVYHGKRLGRVYNGILEHLLDWSVPLETALAQIAANQVELGFQRASTSDGNGIGYVVVATLGVRFFGPHPSSPVILMLGLLAVSACVLLLRFRDQRAGFVVLYFVTLTVMLFTPLTWNPDFAKELAIGGIRYFSLVAILPAFHLLLECADAGPRGAGLKGARLLGAGIQVVIFLLAVLVRNSAMPMLAAFAAGCLAVAWLNRRAPGAARETWRKAWRMGAMAIAFIALLLITASNAYLKEGRFTETVWHRIFVSLGLHPEWPFRGLREKHDCTKHFHLRQGLLAGTDDRNGHCVVVAHIDAHPGESDFVPNATYGRYYDRILRATFFDIAATYPRQTFETFFVIKPRMIWAAMVESFDFRLEGTRPALAALLPAALAILFAWAALMAPGPAVILQLLAMSLLFAAAAVPSYLAAWARPYTSSDLFFHCLLWLELAVALAVAAVARRIIR